MSQTFSPSKISKSNGANFGNTSYSTYSKIISLGFSKYSGAKELEGITSIYFGFSCIRFYLSSYFGFV